MKRSKNIIGLCLTVCLSLTGFARADEIFSTLGPDETFLGSGFVFGQVGPLLLEQAPQFLVTGSDYVFESVDVPLFYLTGDINEITMTLFDTKNGLPGTALDSITVQNLPPPPMASVMNFEFSGGAILRENESYFLSASAAPGSGVFVWPDNDQGITGLRATRRDGVWEANDGDVLGAFRINGSAVPEPGSAALLLLCGLIGGCLRSKR